jgi:hypothetical protein
MLFFTYLPGDLAMKNVFPPYAPNEWNKVRICLISNRADWEIGRFDIETKPPTEKRQPRGSPAYRASATARAGEMGHCGVEGFPVAKARTGKLASATGEPIRRAMLALAESGQ